MLRTVDLTGLEGDYHPRIPRTVLDIAGAMEAVRGARDTVHDRGAEALAEYSQRPDGMVSGTFRAPEWVLAGAAGQPGPGLRETFEESIRRRRLITETLGRDSDPTPTTLAEDAQMGLCNTPVERVGLYIPGGLAPLASSMIMSVAPAQVARIQEIAVASSPQVGFGGWPYPNILTLYHMLGVEEVYAVGEAQAITMFTHGVTGLYAPVAVITGPRNIYVVAAEQLLQGIVGIDSEAGLTEIAIIADSSANPAYAVAGLISQAGHDPMTASVLITGSPELADLMAVELEPRAAATKHRERVHTALTGQQSAVLLVRDLGQTVEVTDTYATEHLEIQTRDVRRVTSRIHNAGAIFVGDHSPVSLDDYSAGSTRVLPTTGYACHGSGLNVRSFMHTVHVIDYSARALSETVDGIERFTLAEDLPGYAAAITVRTRR